MVFDESLEFHSGFPILWLPTRHWQFLLNFTPFKHEAGKIMDAIDSSESRFPCLGLGKSLSLFQSK